ncbi:hypothetical protein SAMN05216379_1671 [Nitrosomonas eutropha]|nr:hypothetical protein [Nitrosomonas eutropha]SCX29937.1 hypothetical protein SAMN05216379_1671 [Nitrosomonas eutropha]
MDGTLIQNEVILGVDTHLDTHVGVVINHQCKVIGKRTYRALLQQLEARMVDWCPLSNKRRCHSGCASLYGVLQLTQIAYHFGKYDSAGV